MKIVLVFICIVTRLQLSAQDSSRLSGQITRNWPNWKLNGKRLNQTDLKLELSKYPTSRNYYKKAQNRMWFSLSFLAATAGVALIPKTTSIGPSRNGLLTVLTTANLGASIYFMMSHTRYKRKAVEAYNKNVY